MMPPHGNPEQLLGALAGVVSAHVVREPDGRIVEIHVLAAPDLHPKQVVRNVESALSAGLGIAIDRRIVSVAQIRTRTGEAANGESAPLEAAPTPERGEQPGSDAANRLTFVRFRSRRDIERCVCEVTLRDDRGDHVGSASGPDTETGRARAAAQAVLAALHRARPELTFALDGTCITTARGRSFVITSARLVLERESVQLSGAASLLRSPEEAAILATLQATNRWSA